MKPIQSNNRWMHIRLLPEDVCNLDQADNALQEGRFDTEHHLHDVILQVDHEQLVSLSQYRGEASYKVWIYENGRGHPRSLPSEVYFPDYLESAIRSIVERGYDEHPLAYTPRVGEPHAMIEVIHDGKITHTFYHGKQR